MSNRYAEKIKRRREELKENKPLTFSSAPNKIWFSLLLIAVASAVGYLSYQAYSSNSPNEWIIPIVIVSNTFIRFNDLVFSEVLCSISAE